jgi:predicted enzyme related to lactoylglutathione lyase
MVVAARRKDGEPRVRSVLAPFVRARTVMSIQNAIASLAVRDLGASAQWYEKLFGRPADSWQMSKVAEWKFERGGWLQIYQSPDRSGLGSLTLSVTSLDEQVAELERSGLDAGPALIAEQVRVVMIKDPDGNSIAFAEASDPSMAR